MIIIGKDEGWKRAVDVLKEAGIDAVAIQDYGHPRLSQVVYEIGSRNRLTTRERSVLAMVLLGDDNEGISLEIGLSRSTIKWHVRNILRKTQCRGRDELMACIFLGNGTKVR